MINHSKHYLNWDAETQTEFEKIYRKEMELDEFNIEDLNPKAFLSKKRSINQINAELKTRQNYYAWLYPIIVQICMFFFVLFLVYLIYLYFCLIGNFFFFCFCLITIKSN